MSFRVTRLRIALGAIGLLIGLGAGGLAGPARSASATSVLYTGTSVIFTGTGSAPDNGNIFWPVSARATFTIEPGNLLQVLLENTSPEPTPAPAALLSSLYFTVGSGTNVPALSYASALGQVYQTSTLNPPVPGVFVPPASFTPGIGLSDLRAFNPGDRTWQFRDDLALVASSPPLKFGVGTVGNSALDPYGFNGAIVDGKDFSIFRGAPQTANLANDRFVKDSVTFQFGGLGDFTLADIPAHVVFGFGTEPYVISVPEPGGLALLAVGGLVCLGWRAWRRIETRTRSGACSWHGPIAASLVSTAVLSAAVLAFLLTSGPVVAQDFPIVLIDNEYDFAKGPEGWVATNVAYNNKPPAQSTWAWQSGTWQVEPIAVLSEFNWVGNYLTSPVIEVAEVVDVLEFNMIHRHNFPINITTGEPITAGQLAYRIFNAQNPTAPFQPFLPGSFASGLVPPPFDGRTPIAEWDVPSFSAPSGLPPLIADGLTWTGASEDFADNAFVASRATLRNLVPGDLVEFRLINANLGRNCDGGVWDVSYVRVNGLFLPEPDGLMLAAAGGCVTGVAGFARHIRRRRHQRASNPSVSPFTNTPPPVSVA